MTGISNLIMAGLAGANFGVGSPTDRIIGSGESFPTFPVPLQYNSLLLNNFYDFDYYHISSVDGADDAELRDSRAVKSNDDGEDAYSSYYGGRLLVINGQIRAYHVWKTDDMREALKRAFARSLIELPLRFRIGDASKDRIIYCKKIAKIEIPMAQPTRDMPWVNYMVPLRASDPRLLSYLTQTYNTTAVPAEFGLINDGNYDAKPWVRITGPATTLTLNRSYRGEDQNIIINNLSSGQYIEIVGATVKDQDGNHAYNRYDDDSDRLTLGPGPAENTFAITGTGLTSSTQVTIEWRHSWI